MQRLLALALLFASPAIAADDPLQRAFPAGSISTREQAAAAVEAARVRAEEIKRAHAAETARCAKVFFVTRCQRDARRQRDAAQREVERVRLEGRDLVRRLDAEERARERAAEEARRRTAAAAVEQREAESRKAFAARQSSAQPPSRTPDAAKPPPAPAAKPRQLTEAQRAENVRRLEEKQRAAAENAKRRAAEREDNVRRREKRRLEREAREKQGASSSSK